MPIQGTAADIIKIAMIRLAERLRRRRLPGAPAAPGPRRAAARGPARRGRPARAGAARDDGVGARPRRAADRRRQGRRRLGVDDAADPGATRSRPRPTSRSRSRRDEHRGHRSDRRDRPPRGWAPAAVAGLVQRGPDGHRGPADRRSCRCRRWTGRTVSLEIANRRDEDRVRRDGPRLRRARR